MQNNPYEAPAAGPVGGDGGLATGSYEFDEAENVIIGKAGNRAFLWGVVAMITGVLGLIGLAIAFSFRAEFVAAGLPSNYLTIFIVALLPLVAVNLAIGLLYIGSGKAMSAVVATQGNDVEHMMQALHKLGSAFLVEFLVGLVALVGGFAAGVMLAVYEPEVLQQMEAVDSDD